MESKRVFFVAHLLAKIHSTSRWMRFFTKVLGLLWSWWTSRAAGGRWKYCNTVKLRMVPGCSMAATYRDHWDGPPSMVWKWILGKTCDLSFLWVFVVDILLPCSSHYHPFDSPCLCVSLGMQEKKGEWDKIQTMGVLTKNWPIDPVGWSQPPVGWSQPPVGWRSFHDLHTSLVRWQVLSCGCNSWISPRAAWSSNSTDLVCCKHVILTITSH